MLDSMSVAGLFQSLAEMLAVPPEWSALPGAQWPLLTDVMEIARQDDNQDALLAVASELAQIPAEKPAVRQTRYDSLFTGHQIHLYESLARYGRLVSSSTYAVRTAYQAAGLAVSGTELPDHASVELAFLAYLMTQESASARDADQWRRARHLFMKQHAGVWLPALGESLAQSRDAVYAPIGKLLVLALQMSQSRPRKKAAKATGQLPGLQEPEACNLCGFCVQVCPTRAFSIQETENITALYMADSACVACNQCVRVCSTQALKMDDRAAVPSWHALRESPRVHCRGCGEPMISQAEWEAVSDQLGSPTWLGYCMECRPILMRDSYEFSR
ncbi:MAG: molecular chaperone TorD family protein [Anaerolineae bacterium]|nr:molecular chaperone TorD family protein [Anaerolineae bacterium]